MKAILMITFYLHRHCTIYYYPDRDNYLISAVMPAWSNFIRHYKIKTTFSKRLFPNFIREVILGRKPQNPSRAYLHVVNSQTIFVVDQNFDCILVSKSPQEQEGCCGQFGDSFIFDFTLQSKEDLVLLKLKYT